MHQHHVVMNRCIYIISSHSNKMFVYYIPYLIFTRGLQTGAMSYPITTERIIPQLRGRRSRIRDPCGRPRHFIRGSAPHHSSPLHELMQIQYIVLLYSDTSSHQFRIGILVPTEKRMNQTSKTHQNQQGKAQCLKTIDSQNHGFRDEQQEPSIS